jgi:hypothetical protein
MKHTNKKQMRMKMKFAFLLFIIVFVRSQNNISEKFEKFAIRQDSLFIAAYDQRDIQTFNKLLTEFLSRYNKLPETEKKKFSGYLNGAYYNLCCVYSLKGEKAMAVKYLKKSIETGYADYRHILSGMKKNLRNCWRDYATLAITFTFLRKQKNIIFQITVRFRNSRISPRMIPILRRYGKHFILTASRAKEAMCSE